MTPPSKRELQNEIDNLDPTQSGQASDDVAVEWREAAPENRPGGLAYDMKTATLTYDVWRAQRECLNALDGGDADIVAFLGGYGSGKSIVGARWLIGQALAHPSSRFLAMGVDFAKARETTFRVLFEQLPGARTAKRTSSLNGPETSPIVADFNRSANRLTLTNDTVIMLGSGDDWKRLAGAEFGGIWLDEPSHYAADLHDLLEMLGSRLRGVDGPKVMCWTLTGNGYNDAWEILEQRQDKTGDPIGLDIELIRASTSQNPYLSDGDISRFERQFGGTAREAQALHGDFAAAQGLVYSSFNRDTHVIPRGEAIDRVADGWRMYGYDAGWADPRVLLEIGKTDYGQFVILDEFHERESHVDDAMAWLGDSAKPTGVIYAEHEPSEIKQIRHAGYPARKAKKELAPGFADVRKRLQTDSDDRVGLLISEQCKHLIREFLGYKEEHVGTSHAVDHCLDALRYAIHTRATHGQTTSWDESLSQRSSSGDWATVHKAGSERARRRDKRNQRWLSKPRSGEEVRRSRSR